MKLIFVLNTALQMNHLAVEITFWFFFSFEKSDLTMFTSISSNLLIYIYVNI